MKESIKRLARGDTKIDFIGRRKLWFAISGGIVLLCLLALPLRPAASSCAPPMPGYFKGLNCGIEFKGGVSIQAPIKEGSPLSELDEIEIVDAVTEGVQDIGVTEPQVQVAELAGDRSVIVQTTELGEAEDQQRFQDAVRELTGSSVEEASPQRIGRKWGGEITKKALQAMVVFLVVVGLFISWRFEWKMALASIIAMFHDLIITAGVYVIVGYEVTPSTVIAILTILGYSLYDNVVVFDKLEENTQLYAATGKMTYEDSANMAINQVFMRSFNTSLSTLLPVAALLFVGAGLLEAGTMKDLALALFIGLLVGAYSSIFVATPILTLLKEREPRYRSIRERLERDASRKVSALTKRAAVAAAETPASVATPDASLAPATEGAAAVAPEPARPVAPRPAAKPRAGTKKARRRKRR